MVDSTIADGPLLSHYIFQKLVSCCGKQMKWLDSCIIDCTSSIYIAETQTMEMQEEKPQ